MGIVIGGLLGTTLLAACSGSEGSDGTGGAAGTAGASSGGNTGSGGSSSAGGNASSGGSSSGGKSGTGGGAGTNAGGGGSPGSGGSGGASSCGCVDQTLTWNQDGGFVAYRETNTLEPCRSFTLVREPVSTDPPSQMCTDPMESCEGLVNPADIQAALGHADVVAALAAAPILYGRDTRPVDGQVFQIHIVDRVIEIGMDCNGAADCIDEPAGVLTLRTYLQTLASQIRARPPCSEL